ncbi:MAG: nuclear transport factor 2 family protein [Pseudomonadota bacterium]|nr:nuclear transport factor 2 family protein [Pseudomonadota bacterium]
MPNAFETAQDAEDAFYDAFEEGSIDAMMAAWAARDDIVCIQPMRHQAIGRQAVRDAWQEVFSSDARLEVEVHHQHWAESDDCAIHIVHEQLTMNGDTRNRPPPIVATNLYRNYGDGWLMVLHHASPPPPPPGMVQGMPPGAGIPVPGMPPR